MEKKKELSDEMKELRRKAEKKVDKKIIELAQNYQEDSTKILHELGVHQIELEMQNAELRKAQLELEESRNKYTDLFDFAPTGYFVVDRQGIITEVNLTGASMVAIERSRLLKCHFSARIETKDKDLFYVKRHEVFETSKSRRFDLKMLSKDNGAFEAELLMEPVTDSAGEVTHCRIAVIDISARKRAEEQAENLAKFPEEDPFPVLRIKKDGTIIYSNTPGQVLLDKWLCKAGQMAPQDWRKAVYETLKSNRYLVKEVHCGDEIFSFAIAPVTERGYVNLYGRDITRTRQAQHALAESERKYRRLFNTMSEGFALHEIILDKKGKPQDYRFLEVNPAFETLTGLSAKDIEGKTVKEAIPGIEQFWIDEYGEVALTGISKKFENFSEPLDRYYEVYAFRPAENQVAVIFTDITKRKKDEEAIRLANERLELAQQGAGAGWWDWDIQTGKLLWSPELFELFGLDPSMNEATFDLWRSVLHPEDRQLAEDWIESAVRDHVQHRSEYRIILPGGNIRWINSLGKVAYDEQGKAVRMTGICFDITERKKAEELLRYHAGLVDNIADAVISTDRKLNVLSWNKAAEQMYGWKAKEVIGNSLKQFIKPEYDDNLTRADVLRQVFENGSWKGEVLQQRRDESKFYVSASLTAIKNAAGENIGFIAVDRDITEQKKAEELLKESEEQARARSEQLNATLEAAPAMIWTSLDRDCKVISGNRMAYEFSMVSRGDNLSKSGNEPEKLAHYRIFQDGRELMPEELPIQQTAATGKELKDCTLDFVFDDGTIRSILGNVTPIFDAQGNPDGAVSVFIDVTERKKAEEALRESEIRYRTLGKTVSYGFWHTDAEGKCTYVSDSFLEMSGMTLHEVLEFGWMHLLPEKDVETTKEQWLDCVKTGEDFQREQCFRSKDGTPRYVLAIGRPVRDEEGKITSWVGINLDITQRKKAEEALRLSEQRFRLALRNAPVSVAAQDHDLRYIWAYNQKTAKREEIVGRFDEDIFTPEEAAHFRDMKQRVLIEGSEFSEQMWVSRPSGRMFVHITWEPVFNKDGEITGVASSTVDMTQLKLAEEELRQKNEDLSRFNKYAVGRELRMIELKKEINKLYEDMGKPPRYKADFIKQNGNERSVSGKLSKDARG